jgi:endonuclease/exonuclease/phosphatase family metal-dependent hydrolase
VGDVPVIVVEELRRGLEAGWVPSMRSSYLPCDVDRGAQHPTALEAYSYPGDALKDYFRNQRAEELAGAIEDWPHPVVLVGDVNVRPTMCKDERLGQPEWPGDQNIVAHQTLLDAGLTEVWPMVYPDDPCGSAGWTRGQDALDGAESTLDHRIDDVFVSDGFSALEAEVVGDEQADRTTSGPWPSDHASTWAKIRLDNVAQAS